MKVICITNQRAPELSVGSEYTVIEFVKDAWGGGYILDEVTPFDHCFAFGIEYFAPCNGPCEIEISEARCREEAEALDIEFAEILQDAETW